MTTGQVVRPFVLLLYLPIGAASVFFYYVFDRGWAVAPALLVWWGGRGLVAWLTRCARCRARELERAPSSPSTR